MYGKIFSSKWFDKISSFLLSREVYESWYNTSGMAIDTGVTTVITGWSEVNSTHSSFNPSIGRFTFPRDGYATITFSLGLASYADFNGTNEYVGIYIVPLDSVTEVIKLNYIIPISTSQFTQAPSVSATVYGKEGERLEFRLRQVSGLSQNIGTSVAQNFLTIIMR